jgi:glycosyltransferase involved in cell wall biosynthesis
VRDATRRLRVAYVSDGLYAYGRSAGHRRYHELASRLSDRHEIHYFTWRFWDGPADITDGGVHLHGVADVPSRYEAGGQLKRRDALRFARRVLPAIEGRRFDVIDCGATPRLPFYATWFGGWLAESPAVVTWFEFEGNDRHPADGRAARIRPGQALIARARRLGSRHVAVTTEVASRLIQAGFPTDQVRVVANGLELEEFEQAPKSSVQSDIVFVGRLIPENRVDMLIEAVSRLRPFLPTVRCLVIGDGPQRPALEELVGARAVREHVWFVGDASGPEKTSLLKGSSVMVVTSPDEAFGAATYEGQAAGLVPVVVRSPQSAKPTMIHDGVDGLVCEPTADAMAAAVGALLSDPFRLALMRAAAGEAVRRRDWEWVSRQMETVYLEAARPGESVEARARRLSWR